MSYWSWFPIPYSDFRFSRWTGWATGRSARATSSLDQGEPWKGLDSLPCAREGLTRKALARAAAVQGGVESRLSDRNSNRPAIELQRRSSDHPRRPPTPAPAGPCLLLAAARPPCPLPPALSRPCSLRQTLTSWRLVVERSLDWVGVHALVALHQELDCGPTGGR